jgi:hypothetical protein
MFRGSLGDFDFEVIEGINPTMAIILYILFSITSIIVFLNMFIAMLNNRLSPIQFISFTCQLPESV